MDTINHLVGMFGWMYTLPALLIFVALIVTCFTKYGDVVIKNDTAPVKSKFKYYCMIFACGMGVSIMTWSMLEPNYYQEAGDSLPQAISNAMVNWGPAWAVYAGFGIAVALLGTYNIKWHRISSLVMAFVTVIGIVLSFCYVAGDYSRYISPYILIAIIAAMSCISAATGLTRGITFVAVCHITFLMVLLAFVLIFADIDFSDLLSAGASGMAHSLVDIPVKLGSISLITHDDKLAGWLSGWSYPYYAAWWGWVIFTGIFIARISNGKTVRQLIIGSVVAPYIGTAVWFTVFSYLNYTTGFDDMKLLLNTLPMSDLMIGFYTVTIIVSLASTIDSAGYVLEGLVTKKITRVMWILIIAAISSVVVAINGDSAVRLIRMAVAITTFPVLLLALKLIWTAYAAHRKNVNIGAASIEL